MLSFREHKSLVNSQGRKRRWDNAQVHSKDFIDWLQEKVHTDDIGGDIFWLAKDPNPKVRRYTGYFVKGYRFYTRQRDSRIKTQNSGVTLTAMTSSFASSRDRNPVDGEVTYYGVIEEIIELDFWSKFSVVLFKCDWFLADIDKCGLTFVNFKKKCSVDDPFVLASQVHQVFFIQDPVEHDIHYVMKRIPREFYDFEDELDEETYWKEPRDSNSKECPSVDLTSSYSTTSGDVRTVDIDEIIGPSSDLNVPENESDFDDTDWDWMHVDDADTLVPES